MKLAILTVVLSSLLPANAALAQEHSAWWQGSWINADTLCDSNDSLVIFSATNVTPWETECQITLQTDIRDTRGVLLDMECIYPDSTDQFFADRWVMLELSDGNMLSYSRADKRAKTLRRCPTM